MDVITFRELCASGVGTTKSPNRPTALEGFGGRETDARVGVM